jgi:tetratricopeptide (TPR) repeat protein
VIHDVTGGWLANFWRALGAPAHALSRIVAPVALSPSYRSWPQSAWLDPFSWIGVLLLVALVATRRRVLVAPRPWLVLGGAFLLALLPTAGVVRVSQLRADRFLYLPLAFVALGIAALACRAIARRPRAGTAGTLLVLAALTWQSHTYSRVWGSDISLWKHVLAQDPQHALANGSLGAIAMEQGHFTLAKRLLDRSLGAAPHQATTWSNLGRWWRYRAGDGPLAVDAIDQRRHKLAQSKRAFERAVELDPRHAAALGQLGLITWWLGDAESAETLLRRALAQPRCPAEAVKTLAALLARQGRADEARDAIATYCRVHPAAQVCN